MSTLNRPLIFVTNDDSIHAPGLTHLVRLASAFGDVVAVAPATPQSAKSSALTVDTPLRITQHPDNYGAKMFTVNGSPVDCVKLGLHAVAGRKPDLLLSGINHGSNSGNAITYSGTMGAALEGCTVGIPSVGFSLCHHSMSADFELSQSFVTKIVAGVLEHGLPRYSALNVNIPARIRPLGVRVCRAAQGHWSEEYREYTDPMGRPFYMLTGRFVNDEPEATDTDEFFLDKGYISVVPVTPDQTLDNAIPTLSQFFDD